MALNCEYEEALTKLGNHERPYYPNELAKALGTKSYPYSYNGSLERCIVQVGIDGKFPHHYILIDNGIFCPANTIKQWGQITGIAKIIPIDK